MSSAVQEALVRDLQALQVPAHKLDLDKPTTVRWLLDNLRVRNWTAPNYKTVMLVLIGHARSKNWFKDKELKVYEAHLNEPVPDPATFKLENKPATPINVRRPVANPAMGAEYGKSYQQLPKGGSLGKQIGKLLQPSISGSKPR